MIHSCIRVMDLAKSEQFYQDAFGFKIARRLDFPDYKFTLSYLAAADDAFELELTYNYEQQEPYQLGNGYSHLAVGVADLEGSHQRHQAQGFAPGPLKGLAGGAPKFYFVADPDGYLVEVVRV
jgi:lactoylglutathione lyase